MQALLLLLSTPSKQESNVCYNLWWKLLLQIEALLILLPWTQKTWVLHNRDVIYVSPRNIDIMTFWTFIVEQNVYCWFNLYCDLAKGQLTVLLSFHLIRDVNDEIICQLLCIWVSKKVGDIVIKWSGIDLWLCHLI